MISLSKLFGSDQSNFRDLSVLLGSAPTFSAACDHSVQVIHDRGARLVVRSRCVLISSSRLVDVEMFLIVPGSCFLLAIAVVYFSFVTEEDEEEMLSNDMFGSSSAGNFKVDRLEDLRAPYQYDLEQNRELTEDQEKQIRTLCECRLARMPVQYIIKEWDFRDLQLTMSPPVFIPRPETEQLVDLVLEAAPPDGLFLEIGCGSGAICLSLLKALPKARVVAVDQSKMACQLTSDNALRNDLTSNLQIIQNEEQETFNHSNTLIDHITATSSTTRHPHRTPSSKPLTLVPKRAQFSIHLISSGRAFERRQA
ncbi:HemK methyltransferase member 1 [Homalodisca vitripennis]|nr:HemK methyltransferase member 1 [Homalodisca vitripennis]